MRWTIAGCRIKIDMYFTLHYLDFMCHRYFECNRTVSLTSVRSAKLNKSLMQPRQQDLADSDLVGGSGTHGRAVHL